METWPRSKFVFTAWRAGQCQAHGGSPELKFPQLLPNLQTLGNFIRGLLGMTAAGRGKLWLLFLKRGFVALGFFFF